MHPPVTKPTADPAGSPSRSTTQLAGDRLGGHHRRGRPRRRPAFWSHAETSQSAPSAAGSVPPMTNPKKRAAPDRGQPGLRRRRRGRRRPGTGSTPVRRAGRRRKRARASRSYVAVAATGRVGHRAQPARACSCGPVEGGREPGGGVTHAPNVRRPRRRPRRLPAMPPSTPRCRCCPRWPRRSPPAAPVVALESTIISHGLPRPDNLDVARRVEEAVRAAGAVPGHRRRARRAWSGSGSTPAELDAVATSDDVVKVSVRDLGHAGGGAAAAARRRSRPPATSRTCAGIGVFATGGLGGVHRGARDTWDESADLTTLGRTPITVVCAGREVDPRRRARRWSGWRRSTSVSSATGTDRFPGFYLTDSGHPVEYRVDSPDEVAAVMAARARSTSTRRWWWPTRCRRTRRSTPPLHDAVLRGGPGRRARRPGSPARR